MGDTTTQQLAVRFEHDLLGERTIPANAYYGIHTQRALENFPITGEALSQYPDLIYALADIKQATAQANQQLGLLDRTRAEAISNACALLRQGRLHDQFPIDVVQGGAGTSTNMNANEVICNIALELMGRPLGDYDTLHPNEHVNLSQSTNDVYPTALKLATYRAGLRLREQLAALEDSFRIKAAEFRGLLKVGRTQLQDAVPMTLGQEFGTYAVMLVSDQLSILACTDPK